MSWYRNPLIVMIIKYNVDVKTLLQQDISERVFYSDLVGKFKGNEGKTSEYDQEYNKHTVNQHMAS